MRNRTIAITFFGLLTLGFFTYLVMNDSPDVKIATENVKEFGEDVVKESKSGIRKVEDAACELVNGEVECAAQELGNEVENASDEVRDHFSGREY